MTPNSRRPTPALFVALIALVVALAGTATALPGKNTVDKNDIKKNAVKSKAIKNGQVKLADLAANSVDGSKIVDGAVAAADLANSEAPHIVGAAGEPAFGNGGQGDCTWVPGSTLIPTLGPVSFHKNALDEVHLHGVAVAEDAAGGDGDCNPGGAGEISDAFVFVLPATHRAANAEIYSGPGGELVLIAGVNDIVVGATTVPAGTVYVPGFSPPQAILDGITFDAATPAAAAAAKRVKAADGKAAEQFLNQLAD